MSRTKLYTKIIVNFIVTLLIAAFLIFVVPRLLRFFLPFVIAYIISAIANPLVKFMEKRVKILRKHSSAIIIVLTIAIIIGVLYLISTILVRELMNLINDVPNIARQVDEVLEELSEKASRFETHFPVQVTNFAETLNASAVEFLANFFAGIQMPSLFQTASGYVKSIANGFLMLIITIVASYFFIAEREKFIEIAKKVFPESLQNGYHLVTNNFKNAVGGYFKAQFKLMFVMLAIMWLTFQLMGISYAFLIALGIAFIDLLPVLGTGAVLGPWVLVLVITGDYLNAVILTILYLVCQVTKQLLQPKMVGDSIGISPMSALIFMFIGYRFYGVFGMIIGIPFGMILINFYRLGAFDRLIRGFKIILSGINDFRKF